MKLSDLEQLEKNIMAEVVKRRGLGGYSTDADGLLMVVESLLKIIGHLIDKEPSAPVRPKK